MHDYKVKTKSSLIEYLTHIGITRTKSRQLLRHRAIGVNGKEVKSLDHILLEGDRVSISKDKKDTEKVPPLGIKIIYEDNVLIVVEKPCGLLTIATDTEKTKTLYFQLNEFLRLRSPLAFERVFIVHRLDRDTSGLIMFAKNEKIKHILQNNWKQVEKRYYAIVEGTPAKKEGVIESCLKETKTLKVFSGSHSVVDLPVGRQGSTLREESKISKTKYKVLKPGKDYTLLDVQLETGHKNQIRVHLADIGHPVVGDKKYGAKTNPFKRLGLYAYVLSFKHPITGKALRFESKIPKIQ
ncbi:MAG TPA: RluA family pseudouridine synthase [Nitrospirae bacterium]|nr:ribosomal large subunit pseudouridine synthase D [bacterium BMS3Abin10]GBE39298.1 ribosomal large subunit pseudouridine synthase D [bacterium BMS3Bbin08]HDH51418.1 RluA family pseudouridine synthase [Nitrospirota bacterium]HDK17541.1 RluA family pseudouridine synthase [Nitrospirota bacterium]HDK81922.1 RluA family pseudouridine synthase [Nitrospirota bacterium]